MKLSDYLRALGAGTLKPTYLDGGICSNLVATFKAPIGMPVRDVVHYGSRTWRHYSGVSRFPIPDPTGRRAPSDAYDSCKVSLWDGLYGALRRELCLHLAGYVEEHGLDDRFEWKEKQ